MTEWCHMIMDKIIQVNLTKIDGMMAFFPILTMKAFLV